MTNFDGNKCQVFNNKGECIFEGTRLCNHYHKLIQSITCNKGTFDKVEIWHQNGHLNYKLIKLASAQIVQGISKFNKKQLRLYDSFQFHKQSITSYKAIQYITTSEVLNLLYIDLIGLMQVESVVGKMYTFVCIDDFSKYT